MYIEGQITNKRLLVYLNDLLSSGEIADLFTAEAPSKMRIINIFILFQNGFKILLNVFVFLQDVFFSVFYSPKMCFLFYNLLQLL